MYSSSVISVSGIVGQQGRPLWSSEHRPFMSVGRNNFALGSLKTSLWGEDDDD